MADRARTRLASHARAGRVTVGAGDAELLRRNILGLAGEQVTLRWLRTAVGATVGVRDAADASDGPSDIEVMTDAGVMGVEVKTTTYGAWHRHGRSIPEEQLWDTNAEVYVWCAGPCSSLLREVHVVGWSTRADIIHNHAAQQYTGSRGYDRRPDAPPHGATDDGRAPQFDLDDADFDEFEWGQAAASRGSGRPDQIDLSGEDEVKNDRSPLALLVDSGWHEGSAPRPGFGSAQQRVRVNAAVRPLAELVDWISQWKPPP